MGDPTVQTLPRDQTGSVSFYETLFDVSNRRRRRRVRHIYQIGSVRRVNIHPLRRLFKGHYSYLSRQLYGNMVPPERVSLRVPTIRVSIVLKLRPTRFLFRTTSVIFALVRFGLKRPNRRLLLSDARLILFPIRSFRTIPPQRLPLCRVSHILIFVVSVMTIRP